MGRGLKSPVQVETKTTADTLSSSVSLKKCKPTANLFHVCDSAAVPLCLSVAALEDPLLRRQIIIIVCILSSKIVKNDTFPKPTIISSNCVIVQPKF